MTQDFQPKNDLEHRLLDAQEGRIPAQEFIITLMGSEVFMPVYEKHQIGGFEAALGRLSDRGIRPGAAPQR